MSEETKEPVEETPETPEARQEPAPVNKAATEYIIENIIHTNVNVLEKK